MKLNFQVVWLFNGHSCSTGLYRGQSMHKAKHHIPTYKTTIPELRRSKTQKSINFCCKENQINTALPDHLFMSFSHPNKHTHPVRPTDLDLASQRPFSHWRKGELEQPTASSWCFHKNKLFLKPATISRVLFYRNSMLMLHPTIL